MLPKMAVRLGHSSRVSPYMYILSTVHWIRTSPPIDHRHFICLAWLALPETFVHPARPSHSHVQPKSPWNQSSCCAVTLFHVSSGAQRQQLASYSGGAGGAGRICGWRRLRKYIPVAVGKERVFCCVQQGLLSQLRAASWEHFTCVLVCADGRPSLLRSHQKRRKNSLS